MKNKIYLSETVHNPGYPSHIPVTVIGEDGIEMDGYLTESQVSRIIKQATASGKIRLPRRGLLNRLFGSVGNSNGL